ncbi:hypothetical protein [Nocardioides sp. AN3]
MTNLPLGMVPHGGTMLLRVAVSSLAAPTEPVASFAAETEPVAILLLVTEPVANFFVVIAALAIWRVCT